MIISSKDNEIIKNIKKLKEKKHRDEENLFIVEGIRIVKEAITEKAKINTIVICEDCIEDNSLDKKLLYEIAKYNCIYVTEKIFKLISEVQNPQGILAVVERKRNKNIIDYTEDFILVLEDLQDPGNLGTILRTLDSIGVKQVIKTKNSGDVYNSKVVRSTMGAIFRINIIETDNLVASINDLKKNGFEIFATDLKTDTTIYDVKLSKTAVIIGNEAVGVSENILKQADKKIKIPMLGKTESLNASVATGIILYEYIRQKLFR